MAQYVRPEGVLLQDCQRYDVEIEGLVKAGLVKRASWYRYSVLRTTEDCEKRESPRLRERVDRNAGSLKRALDYVPSRVAHFLISESVLRLRDGELSYPVNLQELSPYSDIAHGTFNCIITKGLTNELSEILFGLERANCATRATYYVSTRGGETRGERIVISPEAIAFLREYSSNLNQKGLSQNLREAHTLYHGLHDYKLRRDWFAKEKNLTSVRPQTWRDKTSFLLKQGLLKQAPDELVVIDRERLDELLEQLYLEPLKSFLEGDRFPPGEDLPDDMNKRMESIGQVLAQTVDDALRRQEAEGIPGWLDSGTRARVERRFEERVAEDPRTELHQFLTLGELKNLIKKDKVWRLVAGKFVNQRGKELSAAKFQSDDLFFGCLDLVIAYRNPSSHGVYLRPDATNMAIIEASLNKLEDILNEPSRT